MEGDVAKTDRLRDLAPFATQGAGDCGPPSRAGLGVISASSPTIEGVSWEHLAEIAKFDHRYLTMPAALSNWEVSTEQDFFPDFRCPLRKKFAESPPL